jgi:hypothetical protein
MMKRVGIVLGLIFSLRAGAQDPFIESLINDLSIDSMMLYVGQLSGETAVDIGAGPQMIVSRHKDHPGNGMSQAFIQQKLSQFGYSPVLQSFSATGYNVLATKPGVVPGLPAVVIGAHYDAMPGGVYDAPGADDNGSGTAALLEIARVIAEVDLQHPVVFAFWDEEEQGLVGSAFHAGGLAANDVQLRGVINMDALAYDGNGDMKARIHSRAIGNSHEIADTVFAVRAHYNIDLDLLLTVPGATYSDHASFWNEGFGAILIIEEFGADGNPFYHTPEDRVEHFDVPYYEKLARLSLGTLVTLAELPQETAIDHIDPSSIEITVFPNPATDLVHVWISTSSKGSLQVQLIDPLGQVMMEMEEGVLPPGKHAFTFDLHALPAGSYFIRANGSRGSIRTIKLP